jgi:predicted Zn-dependent protease
MKRSLTTILLLFNLSAFAQEKLSIVQQAMRDEMERNMKELKADGFEKPFFLNYALLDATGYQITASLGSLIHSVEIKNRAATSVRLLVGDYEFNDESLDNNLFSQPQGNAIELPLDDDYLGIRRSLWITTDNVYRNASRQFAKNKELLKEQNKPLAEVPHRTFAKVVPSKIDIELPDVKFDRTATEDYIRKVSAVFTELASKDQRFRGSQVSFFYQRGYRYLVNSEGSMNRVPVTLVRFEISASLRTPEGESIFENYLQWYPTPELPAIEKIIGEAKKLSDRLIERAKAPLFDEEYVGPVAFEGREVAELFIAELSAGEDNLVATNNIPSLKGFSMEPKTSIDSKVGKPIFAEGLTVKAQPKMKKYNDHVLLGSFEVDDEGVVPADETILIENGVLKTLMNDRTLVNATQVANGLGDGAGVAMITFKNVVPVATIKSKLIEQAKKEGLEYGLLVKEGPETGASFMDVYKVYVADGREELVRQASMKDISQRNFKKVLAASKEDAVHNTSRGGAILSVICPQTVLFEEVEFSGANFPRMKSEEYVSSPLKK